MSPSPAQDDSPPPARAQSETPEALPKLDLSRIRHDLRTPINHILGYCEMLQEEEGVPPDFLGDLKKIHSGGRQLLSLIKEYFDEETFDQKRSDLHRLCHELRTPVNHIVGYTELLEELAEEQGRAGLLSDLQKIRDAARTWLGLMEEYLVTPQVEAARAAAGGQAPPPITALLQPGIGFTTPAPRSIAVSRGAHGHLLVADDDAANRDILARRLGRQGYEVTEAGSGLDALRLIRRQKYDLVLLDLLMPGLDGYQVLTKLKSDPALVEIPVIMISALDQDNSIARCIEAGAEDYVSKPFNSVFLRARIGACLEKRRLREKERQTYEALVKSQKLLAAELAEAADYVRSLLPAPLEGSIKASWEFLPSTQLGGDAFGYHWIDEKHFAIYLLDVCGHGVGAALLSVSVLNVLRNRGMPGVDFLDPAAVLTSLNRTFAMEEQNNMFFTIWYGVFATDTRELTFASGGHPPAVLLEAASSSTPVQQLRTPGAIVGGMPESTYRSGRCSVAPGCRLFVFSDGVYELAKADGSTAQLDDLVAQLGTRTAGTKLEEVMRWARAIHGSEKFDDDYSILELRFE